MLFWLRAQGTEQPVRAKQAPLGTEGPAGSRVWGLCGLPRRFYTSSKVTAPFSESQPTYRADWEHPYVMDKPSNQQLQLQNIHHSVLCTAYRLQAMCNTLSSPLTQSHTGEVTPIPRKSLNGSIKELHLYFIWEATKLSGDELIITASVTWKRGAQTASAEWCCSCHGNVKMSAGILQQGAKWFSQKPLIGKHAPFLARLCRALLSQNTNAR